MRRWVLATIAALRGLTPAVALALALIWPALVRAGDDPRNADELRTLIREMVAEQSQSGMSVAILEDGAIVWVEGFGWADRQRRIPASEHTTYRVGSLSKTMVSLAALRLQAQGRVDVDAPLPRALDRYYQNPWHDEAPLHLAHLLEHASGFDEMRFNEILAPEGTDHSVEEVLAMNPRSRVPRWRPGERHAYAQTGYTLAARALELASGRDFDRMVHDEVFDPLGLTSATFDSSEGFAGRLAVGYTGPGDASAPWFRLAHRPAGNLFISARDVARVLVVLMARGQHGEGTYLPEALVERMESGGSTPYSRFVRTYGLGNYPVSWTSAGRSSERWQAHGGWMPGYQTTMFYNPRTGDGAVVLSNDTWSDVAHWGVGTRIVEYFESRHPAPAPPPAPEIPDDSVRPFVGKYRFNSYSAALTAPFERMATRKLGIGGDGPFMVSEHGETEVLVPLSERTFRRPWENEASVVVYTDAEGRSVLHDSHGLGSYRREAMVITIGIAAWATIVSAVTAIAMAWPLLWVAVVVVRRVSGRPSTPRRRRVWLWMWPTLAAWSLTAMVHVLFGTAPFMLAYPGPAALSIFVLGWGAAVATIAGTTTALRSGKKMSLDPRSTALRWLRRWSLLANLSLLSIVLYFARDGLVGLRTWLW